MEIMIQVMAPTPAGRAYPAYSHEARILAFSSEGVRPWPYGVDIDGRVVFDLDAGRLLANTDIHVPASRWVVGALSPWPVSEPGDIVFAHEAIAQKSFHKPLRITCTSDRREVEVSFGGGRADRWVKLSETCIALVEGGSLAGFRARL
jgi:hypothetical protein